jgi:hypothetical protein
VNTKLKSEAVFQELKRLIDIPPNCKRLVLAVEIDQPVEVTFECYAAPPKAEQE